MTIRNGARRRLFALAIATLATVSDARAGGPSFDCAKARYPDELTICRVPELAELDRIIAAGYDYLKTNYGRPSADQIGIPTWRARQACQSDVGCVGQRQVEAIKAYQAAGAPISLPDWLTAPSPANNAGSTRVPVRQQGGTFLVPVSINGQITLNFIIDSGASDVSVPADVFLTLLRTGTIGDDDFLDKQTYQLADGSTLPSQRFVIRSLKVGDRVLQNVTGSVAPVQGSLLLGQSFLSRFRSWAFDNERQVLVLN